MDSEPTMPQYSPDDLPRPSYPPSSPAYPPPQRPGLRQRFSSLPLFGKLGLGCGVPLLLLCVCFSGLVAWGSTLPVPPDVLARLHFCSQRRERDLSQHLRNGRLVQSLGVRGIYRLSESSARELETLVLSSASAVPPTV